MRRSTVLNLPLQLVFPDLYNIGDDISSKISNVKLNIINICNLIMLAI